MIMKFIILSAIGYGIWYYLNKVKKTDTPPTKEDNGSQVDTKPKFCSECGALFEKNSLYCGDCGTAVNGQIEYSKKEPK